MPVNEFAWTRWHSGRNPGDGHPRKTTDQAGEGGKGRTAAAVAAAAVAVAAAARGERGRSGEEKRGKIGTPTLAKT